MSGPIAEKDARAETLERWRSEASRLGGVPAEHPGVPAEYVYMANRLVSLIDDLRRRTTDRLAAGGGIPYYSGPWIADELAKLLKGGA